MVAFSDSMARRGYAVACINYRLDTSISNRAVINAMHYAKAAVRFFKSNRTTCKIDTSLIFIGGESAGAITAMTTTYINKTSEVLYSPSSPQSTNVTVEGNSGNPEFSSQTKAALCFCGGTKTVLNELLFDTSAIEINPNPSLLIIHGTNDPLITTSSSLNLAIRANNVGVPNLFYPMYGATHCPWFFPLTDSWKYLDTLIDYTVPFLYACVQNSTNINEVNKILDVNIYPNPAKNTINIVSKSIDNKSITVTITSLDNKLVYNKKEIINGSKLSIDVANLMSGAYIIKLTSGEEYFYEKIIIQ
ncbi:MAG: T9SS type A sorting domain-containing protein [Flavobacteriales bacterium]